MSLIPRTSEILSPGAEASLLHLQPEKRFNLNLLPGANDGGRGARVLLVHTGHLGDVILSIGAMRRVRAVLPNARLAMLVTPPADTLLRALGIFNDVWKLPEIAGWGHTPANYLAWARSILRCERFAPHLGISLLADPEDQLLLALSGAPVRVGGVKDHNWIYTRCWLTHTMRWEALPGSRAERAHVVADLAGVNARSSVLAGNADAPLADMAIPGEATHVANGFLHPNARNIAVLICGSLANRRWPLDNYVELSRRLKLQGANVIAVTGPTERDIAPAVTQRIEAAGHGSHFERKPLLALAALLKGVDYTVTVDSGPGHLSAALGTPTVYLLPERKLGSFLPPGTHVKPVTAREVREVQVDDVLAGLTGIGATDKAMG